MDENLADLLAEALRVLWTCDYAKVDAMLAEHRTQHPAAATLYAESMWFRAFFTEDPEDAKETFARIELAQRLSEATLHQVKRKGKNSILSNTDSETVLALTLWSKLSLAELMLFESMLKFKLQKHVKGAYNFRKSWKLYEECVALLKSLPPTSPSYCNLACSINVGVGFFHFFISIVPRQFLWIVEAIGFKADRNLALRELYQASISEGYQSTLAFFFLVVIRTFFFEELDSGKEMFELLVKQHPDSPVFKYVGGFICRMQGNLDEARTWFREATDLFAATNNRQMALFAASEIAVLEYYNMNFSVAAQGFENFLKESPIGAMKAIYSYHLGLCYTFLFYDDKAKECMVQVGKYVRKGYAYDEFAKIRANKYLLKGGLSEFERKYVRARIHHEARQFQMALEVADQAETLVQTEEERACLAFLRGDCYRELKQPSEAEAQYMIVLNTPAKVVSKHEVYVFPWSLCGMAELKLEQHDYNSATEYLKRAKKYTKYDFESWVSWRVSRGLDRIAAGPPQQ